MLEIEIDGKQIQVPDGSTVMDAAQQVGAYIPHFCYHKKLSIAANCRMCLVQVEKAPKPLPACATPVTNGMKVFTHSELAVKAQKGVMEFLLINHPLDCPICDQGGECQLQDLAVGYGGGASRYQEEKRVVFHKNVGPLISMEEMARCIHCTRCVRFGQEIAGIMELGMANRNMHSEIQTFVGRSVDSELSGNMIDLCPVGALTSKPFRYAARSWELQRRKSVSPHDSVGANLNIQIKNNRVLRVLPRENEAVNECWISDKDRFSYEALNGDSRLTKPMIRVDGQLREVEWNVALDYVSHALKDVVAEHGAGEIGFLGSPHATLEELVLLKKLASGLGSKNIDFRLRRRDFSTDGKLAGRPWLGLRHAEIKDLDVVLVIGSFLRKEQPLVAQRLRQAAKKSTKVSVVSVGGDDQLIRLYQNFTVSPAHLVLVVAAIAKAAAYAKGVPAVSGFDGIEPCDKAKAIAQSLIEGDKRHILLGNVAEQHPEAATLHALVQELAKLTGASFGFLGEAANSLGGYVASALPAANGLNAYEMMAQPRKAYVVLGAELDRDAHNAQLATAAFKQAVFSVVLTPFKDGSFAEMADALLPIAPFTETSGTFINAEGRVQGFNGVVAPLGEARPGWKVLRVLGNVLGLSGFDFMSSEAVRDTAVSSNTEFVSGLDNGLRDAVAVMIAAPAGLQRIADVPIHFADMLARRSPALQLTRDAAAPTARMSAATLAQAGIADGANVTVKQGNGSAALLAKADETVPAGCVRVSAAHATTAGLGDLFGAITVERA